MKPRNHTKKHEVAAFFFVFVISWFRIFYSRSLFRDKTLLIIFCCIGFPFSSFSQDLPPVGSVKIIGQPLINEKKTTLYRKRFYLMRGGLGANDKLIQRLKSTEIISRDCFYSSLKASPEFICWLKKYNCESPYCREITAEDANEVPEFLKAYQKSLRQYGGQSETALKWLTTNLSFDLREGFYRQQKSMTNSLLPDARPLQTTMTDSLLGTAFFVDIPLNLEDAGGAKKKTETFLISNLLPVEIGDSSYVWTCEVEIGNQKQAVLNLKEPKRCVIVTRPLTDCKTQGCTQDK